MLRPVEDSNRANNAYYGDRLHDAHVTTDCEKALYGDSSDVDEHFKTVPLKGSEIKVLRMVTTGYESVNGFLNNIDKFTWVSPTASVVNKNGFFILRLDRGIIAALNSYLMELKLHPYSKIVMMDVPGKTWDDAW